MCTRTPLGRQLGDERFGPATSQMLKRVAANPIEFREIYFSMSRETDALEKRDDFLPAKIMYLKQSLHIKRSLTAR